MDSELSDRFRELAQHVDGLFWGVTIVARIKGPPIVKLAVRGGRDVNVEIVDPTKDEIAQHLAALGELAGVKGGFMAAEKDLAEKDLGDIGREIANAKREMLAELDEEAAEIDEKRVKLRREIKALERLAGGGAPRGKRAASSTGEPEAPLICPLDVMKKAPKRDWSPAELVEQTGRSGAAIASRLNLLKKQGLVKNTGHGKWRVAA